MAARGRGNWVGWVELVKEAVKEAQVANAARVLKEHRTGPQSFNAQALTTAASTSR